MTDYDFQNDWLMIKARNMTPKEIISFMEEVFQIMEIRERLETIRGIKFEVRSREQNHNVPHIHASYDKYSISIAIDSGDVLAGNLPRKQQKLAEDWVKRHKSELLGKWNAIALSATSVTTKSRMG